MWLLRSLLRTIIYGRVLMRLKSCGRNILLSRGGVIHRPEELELGNNVVIARNFHISARSMKIGNNVLIGPNFLAECDDHVFDQVGMTIYSNRNSRNIAPICIQDDIWIGGNVTVLKGVTIGEGCIVGAGSVVSKSLPPYSVCLGTPCRPLRPRFPEPQLREHLRNVGSKLSFEDVLFQWENSGFATLEFLRTQK